MAGVAALLVAAAAVVAAPSPAPASAASVAGTWAAGMCAADEGVSVVVDFGTLDGGQVARCALEPVSTGYDALRRAGFTIEGTQRFPGLLCRIDGQPTPEQDACVAAPAPDFYWAYWTASGPGQPWTYAQEGASTREPPAGSVEGWAFSDGCTRRPGAPTTCASGSTTTTTSTTGVAPAPTTTAPAAGAAPVTSGGGSHAGGATPTGEGAERVGPVAASATTTTGPAGATAPRVGDDEPAALAREEGGGVPAQDAGGGSPVGMAVGALAVAAVVAGAWRARRRGASGIEPT